MRGVYNTKRFSEFCENNIRFECTWLDMLPYIWYLLAVLYPKWEELSLKLHFVMVSYLLFLPSSIPLSFRHTWLHGRSHGDRPSMPSPNHSLSLILWLSQCRQLSLPFSLLLSILSLDLHSLQLHTLDLSNSGRKITIPKEAMRVIQDWLHNWRKVRG